MKYLVKAVKERITEGKQSHIIRVSPEEHRRWTGTRREAQGAQQQLHMEATVDPLSVETNPELDGPAELSGTACLYNTGEDTPVCPARFTEADICLAEQMSASILDPNLITLSLCHANINLNLFVFYSFFLIIKTKINSKHFI